MNRKAKSPSDKSIEAFRKIIWAHYKANGRHDLPWRKTKDPYRILVSEVMLQQTQVSRVLEKYGEFLGAFPTVRTLARAPLSNVLRIWSGLGYNRRAKYLHDAAKIIVQKHDGKIPRSYHELLELPGIGAYTASAIRIFAFNESDILIETNIRTALIHQFFLHTLNVRDSELLTYAKRAASGQDPREWNLALMDYGAHLKRRGVRNNHRSAHYKRQGKFEGSRRQARGAVLRQLCAGKGSQLPMIEIVSQSLGKALKGLVRDGLIVERGGKWAIAELN